MSKYGTNKLSVNHLQFLRKKEKYFPKHICTISTKQVCVQAAMRKHLQSEQVEIKTMYVRKNHNREAAQTKTLGWSQIWWLYTLTNTQTITMMQMMTIPLTYPDERLRVGESLSWVGLDQVAMTQTWKIWRENDSKDLYHLSLWAKRWDIFCCSSISVNREEMCPQKVTYNL